MEMTEADRAIECFVIIDNAKSLRSLQHEGDINDNVINFFKVPGTQQIKQEQVPIKHTIMENCQAQL